MAKQMGHVSTRSGNQALDALVEEYLGDDCCTLALRERQAPYVCRTRLRVVLSTLIADIAPTVRLLRRHILVFTIALAGVLAFGAFFAFARPTYHAEVMKVSPDHGLPYNVVSYDAPDARRAFAAEGIELTPRSKTATMTTLGNRGDILEVDAFGAREQVERAGFYDYVPGNGHYVHFPTSCRVGGDAERWQGNVRVVVSCKAAAGQGEAWLKRVDRALANL